MLLIFDFDGTLADTWDWLAGELIGNAARFGYRAVERAALVRLRSLPTSELLVRLGIRLDRLPALASHLRRRAAQASADFRLFDGIAPLLRQLDGRGHTLALVSSGSDAAVRTTLGPALDALFRARRCGAGVFDKAAAFRELLRETGWSAARTLVIGDETRDFDAAAETGIEALGVEWGYAEPGLLRAKAPGRTAATVEQLAELIAARRGGRDL